MTDIHKGSCFCGAVEFEVHGAPVDKGYCHCDDCRAHSGAPLAGFTLWQAEAVRISRGEDRLGAYNKTGFSSRRVCSDCGGAVLIEHPGLAFVDIPAGKLPSLSFAPTVHPNYVATRHRMADGLPKLRGFPAGIGASGEMMAE